MTRCESWPRPNDGSRALTISAPTWPLSVRLCVKRLQTRRGTYRAIADFVCRAAMPPHRRDLLLALFGGGSMIRSSFVAAVALLVAACADSPAPPTVPSTPLAERSSGVRTTAQANDREDERDEACVGRLRGGFDTTIL